MTSGEWSMLWAGVTFGMVLGEIARWSANRWYDRRNTPRD